MAEPASTAAAMTFAAATATVPVLTAFGVPLGLRADFLVAGFAGAVVAIAVLDIVPPTGDTVVHLVRTSLRRMGVAFASSLTAGYLAPAVLWATNAPEPVMLGIAFAIGGGAREVLKRAIKRVADRVEAQP